MRPSGKTLALLGTVLALCVAGTLALLLVGRAPAEQEHESAYYYTNYPSADYLVTASVENDSGSVVLAQAGGSYYALGGVDAQADGEEVASFFARAGFLPLARMVEGASASDEQYGLSQPRATVVLQDVQDGGVMFRLGGEAPGGEGVYTCLSGDERVFIMDGTYAEPFLEDVQRFYDLTLYPSLEGDGVRQLRAIEVRRDGESVFRLRQAAAAESGSTVWFSLEEPWQMLIGADPVKSALLTPLRQLEGLAVLEGGPEDYGLTEEGDSFRLSYWDGTAVTVLVGPRDGETACMVAAGSDTVLSAPSASLAFMDMSPEDVLGGRLLALNINDIETLILGSHVFEIEGGGGTVGVTRDGESVDAGTFQNTVFTALGRISIGGALDRGAPEGDEVLAIHIGTGLGEDIDLSFCQTDGRRYAVTVNGQLAVWCDQAAVSALLEAAE